MRSAASRIGSSMQALASAVSAAGGSSPATGLVQPTWVRQLAPPGQRGTEPRLPAWQQSRGASCSSGGSGFRPMRSDIARQRRLLAAAAAAQPALATEEEEELGAPWDAQAAWSPAPYPRRILQQRRQAQQSGLHLAGATSTAVGLAAAEPALEEVPREHQREQLARLARLALVREHGQLGSRAAPQQLPQLPVPNLGYTCMNLELWQSEGVRTNRSCWRKTFEAEGLPRVSALGLANCRDLLRIVEWNREHGIHFFRIPSALFPWSGEYELEQLPDYEEIAATLALVGAAARLGRQRLTAHPSHFVQLASTDPALLGRSLRHLELNSQVFDLMGYAPSHENKINIHVGAVRGSKARSLARFAAAADRLSDACRARLTVENDDRCWGYSLADLLPLHAMSGVPLVFDYLHHALVPGGLAEGEALAAAAATWPRGVRPVVHYSEPSEDPSLPRRAHSRMLTQPFDLHGLEAEVDVMLEAKGMERALLFWRDELQLGRKRSSEVVWSRCRAAGGGG